MFIMTKPTHVYAQRVWAKFVVVIALVFTLGGCSSTTTPAPVDHVYRGFSVHDYEKASLHGDTHQVQRGETLYSIAFRANMDLRELARLNNLQDPYTIFVGQTLRLRDSAAHTRQNVARSNTTNENNNNQSNVIVNPIATTSQSEYGGNVNQQKTVPKQEASRPTTVATAPPVATTTGTSSPTQGTAAQTAAQTTTQTTSRPSAPPQRQQTNAEIRWQWPTQAQLVRRFSNQAGGNGMEFAGRRGEPVLAAAAGRVVYVGTALRGYGQLIILKHSDDYITAYGHNDQILVQEQQWVESGQQIATMGSSGREDVRLRFELRFRGNSVNPENYLPKK
ncbi:peptidase M23 [Aliidiomarina haloalkalitolerans]|uniref:Peptidase M23 n=2 Tax=Aliidiomarina haloalkalitolerans TaxID=859059 RepID=A0A432VZJ0_9GAMM|nr:peptidase M23 [Aliidiomarina haloalkalitolerans]